LERKERKAEKTGEVMIPRSVIVGAVRGAVTERTDDRIEQLADIIHGGMVWALEREARLEEVDRRLEAQHAEVVHAVDSMKAGFALMDQRFLSMDKRFDGLIREMNGRFEAMNERFVSMDERFESMDARFESMDKRFDGLIREMNSRFETVDKRFESVDKRFDGLIREMNVRFEAADKRFSILTWLIGVGFVVMNATLVLLKIF